MKRVKQNIKQVACNSWRDLIAYPLYCALNTKLNRVKGTVN